LRLKLIKYRKTGPNITIHVDSRGSIIARDADIFIFIISGMCPIKHILGTSVKRSPAQINV
jgi:hypothetical protein